MARTPPPPDNEAIRELRDEVKNLNKSTKRASVIMIILTIALVILTVVLAWQGLK